jgi:hypothetical protein
MSRHGCYEHRPPRSCCRWRTYFSCLLLLRGLISKALMSWGLSRTCYSARRGGLGEKACGSRFHRAAVLITFVRSDYIKLSSWIWTAIMQRWDGAPSVVDECDGIVDSRSDVELWPKKNYRGEARCWLAGVLVLFGEKLELSMIIYGMLNHHLWKRSSPVIWKLKYRPFNLTVCKSVQDSREGQFGKPSSIARLSFRSEAPTCRLTNHSLLLYTVTYSRTLEL